MIKKAYVILGHEIKFPSHELSASSRARCDLLHDLLSSENSDEYIVLFMGKGRMQRDCPLSISQCMYKYFSQTYFSLVNYYIDFDSLDTVGDAVYSHRFLSRYPYISELDVVTSDWHMPRVSTVFTFVHSPHRYSIKFSASVESSLVPFEILKEKKQTEINSLKKFKTDFLGKSACPDWVNLIKKVHPLYINQ